MPSPGSPNTTSTPQSWSVSIRQSAAVMLFLAGAPRPARAAPLAGPHCPAPLRGFSCGPYFPRSNRGAKPAAFEACPAKPVDDERTAPHEAPNQSRSVVFDHQNHRTLIQGEVSMGDPTCLVLRRPAKRRVDAAHEPVFRNRPRQPLQIMVD